MPESKEEYKGHGGVVISRYKKKIFIDDSAVNNLIIGTTRSGKGETYVFPTIDVYSRAEEKPSMIIRELLWSIVRVLAYIVDTISAITNKLFVLDTFYNDPNVIKFINSFKPLIVVLFAISFCMVGYQLMFSQTKQFRKIGENVLVAIFVILVLPMAMDKMNTLTSTGVSGVVGKSPILANEIIKGNVVDLVTYDTANFNSDAIKQLTSGNILVVMHLVLMIRINRPQDNMQKIRSEKRFKIMVFISKPLNHIV